MRHHRAKGQKKVRGPSLPSTRDGADYSANCDGTELRVIEGLASGLPPQVPTRDYSQDVSVGTLHASHKLTGNLYLSLRAWHFKTMHILQGLSSPKMPSGK